MRENVPVFNGVTSRSVNTGRTLWRGPMSGLRRRLGAPRRAAAGVPAGVGADVPVMPLRPFPPFLDFLSSVTRIRYGPAWLRTGFCGPFRLPRLGRFRLRRRFASSPGLCLQRLPALGARCPPRALPNRSRPRLHVPIARAYSSCRRRSRSGSRRPPPRGGTG